MNETERLNALRQRLGDISQRVVRQYDKCDSVRCGQLWPVKGADEDETPSWLLLITEELGDGLFNACPVFRWGELAGPEDVYLPSSLAGANLIVSIELESTVNSSMLDPDKCYGRLPREAVAFVLHAKAVLEDTAVRDDFSWGMEYAQHNDVRLAYHEQINSCLEVAQAEVRAKILAGEGLAKVQAGSPSESQTSASEANALVVIVVDFARNVPERRSVQDEYARAAASSSPDRPLWNFCLVCDDPTVKVRIIELISGNKMAAKIEEGHDVLAGAVLTDETGKQLGLFDKKRVPPIDIPMQKKMGIRLANGTYLKLRIEVG